jgi:hypothetical protein
MAHFEFETIMEGAGSGFGAGVFISALALATEGAKAILQTAITNPYTAFFTALGVGLGFAYEHHQYNKRLDKEKEAEAKE